MKKILSILIVVCLVFTLFGCAKCVNTEYRDVEVKIVNVYRRGARRVGSAYRPAKHKVTVEYNDSEYVISGRETYNKYKDRIGQTTSGTLETRTYDDGTTRQYITQLE